MGFLTDFLQGQQKPTSQQLARDAQKNQASGAPVNTGRVVENPTNPDAFRNAYAKAKDGVVSGDFESGTVTGLAITAENAARARQQAEQLAIAQGADLAGQQAMRAAGIDMGLGRRLQQQDVEDVQQGPLRAVGVGSETFDFQALIKAKIVRNPLDAYANYTYHIKFWMTSDSVGETLAETTNKSVIDKVPKVVIAESGVTVGFNISEFTYRNLTGTTPETRNMPSISWTMKITEPYGFSLPDRLATASREIGVLNWQRGKYFIQLWFTGYDENGTPVDQALYHQVFRVSIINIDFNGNEGGGNYEIKGLFDGMTAFTNQLSLAEKNINISAKTVGEMFDKLSTALNNNAIDLAYGTAPLEQYKIQYPEEMKNWAINTNRLNDDARSRNMNIKADGNTVTVNASPGVDFSNMVYRIVSLTDEFTRWSQSAEGTNNPTGTLSHGLVKNIKVHARVEYVGYDTLAKDYVKRITYSLVPYYETRVRGPIPTVRNNEKRNIQQDKLRFLFSSNRIKKAYQWIYTGQNLDIIKFEFKVNNFWVIASAPFAGANYVSNHTQGPLSKETSEAWQARQERYKQAKLNYEKLQKDVTQAEKDLTNVDRNIKTQIANAETELQSLSENKILNSAYKQELQRGLYFELQQLREKTDYAAEDRLASSRLKLEQAREELAASRRDFVDFYEQNRNGQISSNPLAQQRLAQETDFNNRYQQAVKSGQRDLFVEDQDIRDIPDMPFTNTVIPDQAAGTADGNQGAASRQTEGIAANKANFAKGRNLFGAVVGNFDSVNKEMINIELEIRGDPYWLGHSNIDVTSKVPTSLQQLSNDYAEYLGGDNLFYLSFRSGQAPDEQTGFMQFTTNNQFVDGFYSVIEVKNTFSNGRFTQVLKSFKDTFSQTGNSAMEEYNKKAEAAEQAKAADKVRRDKDKAAAATVPGVLLGLDEYDQLGTFIRR